MTTFLAIARDVPPEGGPPAEPPSAVADEHPVEGEEDEQQGTHRPDDNSGDGAFGKPDENVMHEPAALDKNCASSHPSPPLGA